jgi:hypothetical protein
MLKLRPIGPRDYSVYDDGQRIGRIRFAEERMPSVWLWNVSIHLPGGLPMGSAKDLDTAKAEFKAAWENQENRSAPACVNGVLGHGSPASRERPRQLSDEMIKAVKPYDAGQN